MKHVAPLFWSVVFAPFRLVAEFGAAVALVVWRALCDHPPAKAVPTFQLTADAGYCLGRRCGICGAEVSL